MDRLTGKFPMAGADTQSPVLGRDHPLIEPLHVLLARLDTNRISKCRSTASAGYVQDHRKLWQALWIGGVNAAMCARFSPVSGELMQGRPRYNPRPPLEPAEEVVVNAIFEILTWWMRQPDDYPIGNVIKLLDTLVVRIYTRLLDIRLE